MRAPPIVPVDVAGQPALSRFWSGACLAASGIPTTLGSGRLFALALVPIAVQTAIFVGLVVLGLSLHGDALAWIGIEGDSFLASLARGVISFLLGALIVVVGLLLTMFAGSIVLDPFYDVLSEEAEKKLAGRAFGAPFTLAGVGPGMLRELGATLLRLSVYVPVAMGIWLLGFVPVVGPFVGAPLGLAWTWLFVAYEIVARSLARHGLPARARLRFVFAHKAVALGFGAAAWLCLFLPFLAPFLVVGGTRMYLALAAFDHAPSRLDEGAKRALRGLL
jgi:CysZ protein